MLSAVFRPPSCVKTMPGLSSLSNLSLTTYWILPFVSFQWIAELFWVPVVPRVSHSNFVSVSSSTIEPRAHHHSSSSSSSSSPSSLLPLRSPPSMNMSNPCVGRKHSQHMFWCTGTVTKLRQHERAVTRILLREDVVRLLWYSLPWSFPVVGWFSDGSAIVQRCFSDGSAMP